MRELTFHRIHTRNHNISKLIQTQILVDYYVGMMMAVSFEQEAKVLVAIVFSEVGRYALSSDGLP